MSCVAPGTWAEQAAFKARSTSRDSGWRSAAEERAGSGLAPCFCNADFLTITAITAQGPGPAHRRGHRHQKIGLFSTVQRVAKGTRVFTPTGRTSARQYPVSYIVCQRVGPPATVCAGCVISPSLVGTLDDLREAQEKEMSGLGTTAGGRS